MGCRRSVRTDCPRALPVPTERPIEPPGSWAEHFLDMTDAEKLAFKGRLKQWGLDLIGQRVRTSTEAMDAAQQAANNEEKSSAGDKYETSRAMGHLQKDMHARQLAESVKELAALHALSVDSLYSTAQPGAF